MLWRIVKMVVSSMYSVFSTNRMDALLEQFEKIGALSLKHHLKNDAFDYYIMEDASGNSTDFIQFKNKEVKEGFFAFRMNVNNYDRMEMLLTERGYAQSGSLIETDTAKYAHFVSADGEPDVMLFYHKKGSAQDAWDSVIKFMSL